MANYGAVWILFLNSNGTVKTHQKLSNTHGGLAGQLTLGARMGRFMTARGDLDGDGVGDLSVEHGADFWTPFLFPTGTMKTVHKLTPPIGASGNVGVVGDLDGDGVQDLASAGVNSQSIYMLFMNADGTVRGSGLITPDNTPELLDVFWFPRALNGPSDMNGDGVLDLVVGDPYDAPLDNRSGAIWFLFLNPNGGVKASQKVNDLLGGFPDPIAYQDAFGWSLT